jgi:hypothetical protein
MPKQPKPLSPARQLAKWFDAHGWVQSPPKKMAGRKKKTSQSKRGYEVRLTATPREAPGLVRLLKRAGFDPGKPYPKGNRLRVPLYGKEQVARFLALTGAR